MNIILKKPLIKIKYRDFNKDKLIDNKKNQFKKTKENFNVSKINNDKIEIKDEISIINQISIKEDSSLIIKDEVEIKDNKFF